MAVNLKDDYEKLAKLLYPSIEASGNVYYGTTRKLTMDALLDKTDIGFESYTANNRFEWKLGPLHSFVIISSIEDNIVNADTFGGYNIYRIYQDGSVDSEPITGTDPVYGTFFAKYILAVDTSNAASNLTNAGDFTTYEYNVKFIPAVNGNVHGIYVTDNFDPANPTGYDIYDIQDRHFFITKEENQIVLYVKVAHCEESESDYKSQPITFTHKRLGNITSSTVTLNCHGDYGDSYQCQYRQLSLVGGNFIWSNWQNYTISTPITLYSNDEQIQFRSNGDAPQQEDSRDYLYFTTSGRLEVSGNVMSLLDDCFNDGPAHDSITWYKNGLTLLFSECVDIINAENLVLPSELEETTASYLYTGSYYGMFNGCTGLKLPPKVLPATVLTNNIGAYGYMFFNCTRLVKAPKILAAYLSERCFTHMFGGCTSLSWGGDILPATVLADSCYHSMFYNCQSLERSPKLPATTLGNTEYAYASMFLSCSSLSSVYCNLIDSSSTVSIGEQDFLLYTASNGVLYTNSKSDWNLSQVLPSGWSLQNNPCDEATETVGDYINFIPDYNTRFTVDARNAFNESNYLVITGFDSELNGRGYLTDDTLYNMEQFFDENNTHYTNEYNQDGSYNQEIWGYKSFNSPVQFRNGIYGDNFSLITEPAQCTFSYKDGDNDGEADIQLNVGSVLQCKVKDTDGINYTPASKVYQYSAASEEYEISDASYVDYATENNIYSTLYGNDLLNHTLGHGYEKVYECAAARTMAKTYTSANSPVQTIQRYVTNMSSGESYISIISEYDENHTYLANSSSIRLALYDNVDASGIIESSIDILNRDFTKSADDIEEGYYSKYESKSTTLTNGILYDESDELPCNCLKTGSILEIENGVNTIYTDDNEVFATIDMPHIVAKSKQFMGPGHDLDEALLIISGMNGASSQAILQTTSNRVSNSHTYIGTVSVRDISTLPGSIQLKSEVISDDPNETWDRKSAQIDLTYNGCEINQVPIGPIKRTFSNNPVFTKGSVHILIITSFGSAVSAIHCGDIIKSATVQGSNIWCVNKALVTLSVGLSTLAINASGVTSTVSLSAGGNNSSVMFKVLSNRYPTDTDKSLIVVCMTDDSLA